MLAAGLLFIVIGLTWFSRVSVGGGFTTDILGPSLFAAAALGFVLTLVLIRGSDSRAHVALGTGAASEAREQEATEAASA